MENLTPGVQSAGEAEKPSWAIPPKTERDLLIASLRVINETSGTLNEISSELFKVTGDEADDPKYERLHELLRRRFNVNSGVHLFQAAHNLKIDLPDDLKGEPESDIEDDGEPPDTDEAVWHVAEGGMVRLELREAYYAASDRVFNVLLLTGDTDVHLSTVEGWSLEQRKAAAEWALSLYTAASDNDDVVVPPRPDFIPRRSADGRNPVTGEASND